MNNKPIKNDASEFAPGDEKVSSLLSAMKRVEAPNDFDFRVKARIAAGRPADRRPFGLPVAVGYAIPLVLLVLFGVYFGFNAYYGNKNVSEPVVASAPPVSTAPQTPPSNNDIVTPQNVMSDERAGVKKPENIGETPLISPVKKAPNSVLPSNRTGYGYRDDAVRQERKLYPRGINPNQLPPTNASGLDRTAPIPATDVLNLFGMSGAFGDEGWKVESVATDTLASRSGIKAGDVVEAINDQALTEKTSFKGKFNGKSLRVRRDGASIQIVLKN